MQNVISRVCLSRNVNLINDYKSRQCRRATAAVYSSEKDAFLFLARAELFPAHTHTHTQTFSHSLCTLLERRASARYARFNVARCWVISNNPPLNAQNLGAREWRPPHARIIYIRQPERCKISLLLYNNFLFLFQNVKKIFLCNIFYFIFFKCILINMRERN